jgi:hypothetical protein
MSKTPPPGRCVHCLEEFSNLTWDHVFPVAWYFDETPPNFEKWKVPSCEPCNASHGKMENDLLTRIGLCLDPNHPDTGPIAAKALRALNAGAASNSKDAAARDAKRLKIMNQAQAAAAIEIPAHSIYPGFGPTSADGEVRTPLPVPKRAIDALGKKLVRGVTYLQDGRFIEPPYEIVCYVPTEEGVAEIFGSLTEQFRSHDRGPALVIHRSVREDGMSAIYRMEIWSRLRICATVMDPTYDAVA